MNTAIYSLNGGVGKTTLANRLASVNQRPLVSLDTQDGGSIDLAKSAPDNAILDCAPKREHGISVVESTDHLIFILKDVNIINVEHYFFIVRDELLVLKTINPNLSVFMQFAYNYQAQSVQGKRIQELAKKIISSLSFVEFGLPPYLKNE
ncbi:hypothetical protein GNP82_07970 [Aliivibrio fischeri]|uniref:hypothetical protein n=1 Tax=Aliivibrio fischeri TaxID=668 RepID=UPI0012D86704|nr:hypothetical protein [Aliivibrio fischeri]MUK37484.1 hypothetical protein [Aliivibrio fischeri]